MTLQVKAADSARGTRRRWCLRLCLLLALVSPQLSAGQTGQSSPLRLSVEWEPATLFVGAPFLLRVASSQPIESLKGSWLGREIFFEFDPRSGRWSGLAGVGLETAPGSHQLSLTGESVAGGRVLLRQSLAVTRAAYRSSALSVPRRYTEPDAATTARIAEEQALKKEVFARISPARQWGGVFLAPLEGVTTEPFGTQRTFNREVQSVHQGLDYRAGSGTPIRVMNNGTVILARELFFEGNCVVVDHGQGLLSLYLHLSELKVKEGESVRKAQIMGLSGATGRVTAPHLHVAIRWQGVYLDPARLLRLTIP